MGLVTLLAALALALAAAMAMAWVIARRPGRSGWTDVSWSYAVGLAGVVTSKAYSARPPRRMLA